MESVIPHLEARIRELSAERKNIATGHPEREDRRTLLASTIHSMENLLPDIRALEAMPNTTERAHALSIYASGLASEVRFYLIEGVSMRLNGFPSGNESMNGSGLAYAEASVLLNATVRAYYSAQRQAREAAQA